MRSRGKRAYHGESILNYFCKKTSTDEKTESTGTKAHYFSELEPVGKIGRTTLGNSWLPKKSESQIDGSESKKFNGPTTVARPIVSKCPKYKWVEETPFTVDAFRYGEIPGCQGYFLSHFHFDHYGGLKKTFGGPIFCSQVTLGFLRQNFSSGLNVTGMDLNRTYLICGFEVMAIDANHCPGSVMFLFHSPNRKRFVLHTGDFRFSFDMLSHPSPLAQLVPSAKPHSPLHTIYLDTTYCAPQYDFVSQQDVIDSAVQVTRDFLMKNPSALIACGMYSIGKERFVYGLAKALNLTVWLPKQQEKFVRVAALHGCPVCQALVNCTSNSRRDAQLHVISMNQINLGQLMRYRQSADVTTVPTTGRVPVQTTKIAEHARVILAWRPTGWSHVPGSHATARQSSVNRGVRLERSNGQVYIYGAAYSEHSSFLELRDFITALRPQRVQPTVFGKESREHHRLINHWLKSTTCDV